MSKIDLRDPFGTTLLFYQSSIRFHFANVYVNRLIISQDLWFPFKPLSKINHLLAYKFKRLSYFVGVSLVISEGLEAWSYFRGEFNREKPTATKYYCELRLYVRIVKLPFDNCFHVKSAETKIFVTSGVSIVKTHKPPR